VVPSADPGFEVDGATEFQNPGEAGPMLWQFFTELFRQLDVTPRAVWRCDEAVLAAASCGGEQKQTNARLMKTSAADRLTSARAVTLGGYRGNSRMSAWRRIWY
jgi:hypothetical protein